LNEPQQNEEED